MLDGRRARCLINQATYYNIYIYIYFTYIFFFFLEKKEETSLQSPTLRTSTITNQYFPRYIFFISSMILGRVKSNHLNYHS